MRKFLLTLRAWFYCVRADWHYPEWRNLKHVLWVWRQVNDDWFDLTLTVADYIEWGDFSSSDEWDEYDPYFDEG